MTEYTTTSNGSGPHGHIYQDPALYKLQPPRYAPEEAPDDPLQRLFQHKKLLLILLSVALAGVIGSIAAEQPILTIVSIIAVVLAPLSIMWPELATYCVIFLLYSNIPVVAHKFHGVPYFLSAAFTGLLVVPLATYIVFRRQQPLTYATYPYLLGFVLVQLVGALFSRNVQLATSSFIGFLAEGVVLYLVVINVVRNERTLRRVTWVLLLAGILLAVFPLHQQLTGNLDNNYGGFAQVTDLGFRTGEESILGDVRQYRASGAIGEQNRYGQVMLMIVPLGLFMYLSARRHWLRALALTGAGLSFLGVAFTFSRGAVVACVILLGVMVLLRIIRARHFLAVVLASAVVLLALPQYQTRLNTLPQVLDVFTGSMSEETDGSFRGRTAEMLAAFLVFVDHPIVGVGPDMFQYYSQEYANPLGIRHLDTTREAHSLPPDIAANHGILGLITFFGIFFITMRDLHELWRKLASSHPRLSALCAGYFLALVAYLATGLFLHLSYVRYLWLMLALAAATAIIARRALEQDEKQRYQVLEVAYQAPRVTPPTGSTPTST